MTALLLASCTTTTADHVLPSAGYWDLSAQSAITPVPLSAKCWDTGSLRAEDTKRQGYQRVVQDHVRWTVFNNCVQWSFKS